MNPKDPKEAYSKDPFVLAVLFATLTAILAVSLYSGIDVSVHHTNNFLIKTFATEISFVVANWPKAVFEVAMTGIMGFYMFFLSRSVWLIHTNRDLEMRQFRKKEGLCPECGYTIHGSSKRQCPECGCTDIPDSTNTPQAATQPAD